MTKDKGFKPSSPKKPTTKASHKDPYAAREARRYENPIVSREALIEFLGQSAELMTAERIADSLKLHAPTAFDALGKRLAAMVRDGQLLVNRRGGYGVAKRLDLIAGVVLANSDGFGFLRADAGGDDLYIAPGQMRAVLHGDRVLVSVGGVDRRGRREAVIVEILERRTTRVVGRYLEEDGFGRVVADDKHIHLDVVITQGKENKARNGQIVVAEITHPPTRERPPMGRVASVLGDRLNPSLLVQMAIESHGIAQAWSPEVEAEVAKVQPEVSAKDIKGRVDIRELPLLTIDGEDARDFDDAVYCEPSAKGFRLVVAIADVSHYVPLGTELDAEAQRRSTSVYFPGFVVPMLPEVLSNGICSLNPKVDRMCMVCDMQISSKGEVLEAQFYEAVMRSHARLTYTQVWQAVGEKDAATIDKLKAVMPQLENLHSLYRVMDKARKARGAIEFESTEVKFVLAPGGDVVSLGAQERNDAHKLIEECMIAANVAAARFLSKVKIPALYRTHDKPPQSKFDDLQEFLTEFGFRLPEYEKMVPADYAALLRKIRDRPDAFMIESVVLRSQSLAVYSAENGGHFGLSLDAYAHFTSPIRRYPDLLVHRALKYAVAKGKRSDYVYSDSEMNNLAVHCSTQSRRAEEAERDVDERYKCAWMEKHIGSEFAGIVTGVTSFGLFVEMADTRISGLVHVTQLPNDYYHFDPARHLMQGERRGLQFRIGDEVRVLVLRASLEDRKIDLRLAGEHASSDAESRGKASVRKTQDGNRDARGPKPVAKAKSKVKGQVKSKHKKKVEAASAKPSKSKSPRARITKNKGKRKPKS